MHNMERAGLRAPVPVLLSLGSNIRPEQHLRAALGELRATFGPILASPGYRNPAIGFDGAPFINCGVLLHTWLELPALESWLHGLEDRYGRDRRIRGLADRTLDLDVVFYGDRVTEHEGRPRLPRPERTYAFVLKPLAEIAPEFIDPVHGQPLGTLWLQHPDHATAYERVDLEG
jgi:2-amino-4-hydroxy-6-hydroxymethyldihydropteridine diphosphokinase